MNEKAGQVRVHLANNQTIPAESLERWFRLYDTSGSLIREERLLGTFLTVDLQGIRSGLYIYELQSGSASYTGRVVVR